MSGHPAAKSFGPADPSLAAGPEPFLLLKRLLGNGFFPKELPDCFSTATLASVLTAQPGSLPPVWAQAATKPPSSLAAHHNLARAGTLRRRLSVPNPVAFFALASTIDKSWEKLDSHMAQSRLSRSRPVNGTERAFETEVHFSKLVEERARCRRRGRYVLQADVSQFYHSLYTHSIPWALHGKEVSKKAPVDKSLMGNVLDELVRCGQDRQSVGIPIGPDSSLVLAELLMSAVDAAVDPHIRYAGAFRFVDDWEMSFTTLARAEQGLAQLQQVLGEWELTLNPKKTHIRELPLSLESPWAFELGRFHLEKGGRRGRASLLHFFDLVFRLAATYPDETVVKYALGRLRREKIVKENWDLLESLLFQSVNAEPGVLNYVLDVVERYARAGCYIDRKGLARLLSDQIVLHAPRGHGSEVLWALWGALRFDLELDAPAAAAVLKIQDAFVAILALDLMKRGNIKPPQASVWWDSVMVPEALYGPNWLLSYEAGIKKLLPGGKAHITKNAYFSFLKTAAVEFYIPVEKFVLPNAPEPVAQVLPDPGSGGGLAGYS